VQVGQKLRQAPVYFTLAQVRFNPVLALDSYVPKIQDHLRRQGYPDAKKGMLATFNLNVDNRAEGGAPQVPVSQTMRYAFSTIAKTEGFILDPASLSYQTTEYGTFEDFAEKFLRGLEIVHQAISLSYTDRIGLRYLDAVYPKENEHLSEYLSEAVLGLYGRLDGSLVHAFSETVIKNDARTVVARTILQNGPIGFPPDLQPIELQLPERFQNLKGLHAILDTDGSRGHRDIFDLNQIKAHLSEVHSVVIEAFKAIVTERAVQIWE
jgi:uncharacterized protein (TIGR04255 family)